MSNTDFMHLPPDLTAFARAAAAVVKNGKPLKVATCRASSAMMIACYASLFRRLQETDSETRNLEFSEAALARVVLTGKSVCELDETVVIQGKAWLKDELPKPRD